MEETFRKNPLWLSILRWGARVIAILIVAFILMMFIGEGGFWSQPANMPLTTRDYVLLSVMGIYWIGLIIGLRWEFWGGLISLALMSTLILSLQFTHTGGLWFDLMLVPGILYLLSWYLHRRHCRQSSKLP
jgi:hypothetical protein